MIGAIRNLKIHTKLFWSYCLVLVIPLGIGSTAAYSRYRSTLEDHYRTELKQTTQSLFTLVQSTVHATVKSRLAAVAEKNKEIVAPFVSPGPGGRLFHDRGATEGQADLQEPRPSDKADTSIASTARGCLPFIRFRAPKGQMRPVLPLSRNSSGCATGIWSTIGKIPEKRPAVPRFFS